ncbi:MAG TPA: PilZ domain-containing protein [Spirochaetota bacterium]|nr:PilZ domain-containing protein [Spirochaetota bacterium]HPH02800.1 PilZ domain-containing protein [Spirochaetota bacterium]HPN82343.1 PilZ domain-containing protein [Spirochaetota bacterium]
MNFLLVDTKTSLRDILIRKLFANGINLYYAETLEAAHKIISSTKITILLIDIDVYPTKAFAFLKMLGLLPSKPVRIVSSSLTDKKTILPFVNIGIAGWLVKPFTEDKSLPKLMDIIRGITPADEQRTFFRVTPGKNDDRKVFFRLPSSAKLYSATLLNISAGGLALNTPEEIPAPELDLGVFISKIQIKLASQDMDLSGEVVYKSGTVFALRLKDCHERDMYILSKYIFDHISMTVHPVE